MSKIKKTLLIIFVPIILLIFLIIFLSLFKKEPKASDPLDSLVSTDIFNQDVNIIIEKTNKSEIKKIEVENNKNKYMVDNKEISVDTSDNLILSNSYFKINEEFGILELLIGLDGNIGYMNDAQLSTSYDFAKLYSKKWILIDNKNNLQYDILENYKYDLLLNTTLNEKNLEVDYMYVFGKETFADHLTIPIEDIIDNAISGTKINYKNYSIYDNKEVPTFSPASLVKTTETSLDLNGDSVEDKIIIDFHTGNNITENGISIKINDVSRDFLIFDVCQTVRIIDLNKNDKFKELLFVSNNNSEKNYSTLIISFNGEEIIRTFKCNERIEEFQLELTNNNFENFEITLNEDGMIPITYHIGDSIQRWKLKAYLEFKDNKLFFSKGEKDYYESLIIREATAVIDIFLYEDMDFNSDVIEIKGGETMNFIGTTLDYWGVVEYNENIYYLPIDKMGRIYEANAYVYDIFNGLAIYD